MTRWAAVLSIALAGCGQVPCGDVGRAIHDRTLSCEGSSSMGVGRARALQFTYACPADGWWDPLAVSAACAAAIEDLDCTAVRENGNDLDAWLSAHPSCDALEPLPPRGPQTTPTEPPPTDTGPTGTPLDTLPCSVAGGQPTDMTVTNASGIAVDVFWRDDACEQQLYFTLAADESFVQPTTTGHVWVARELTGARPVVDDHTATDAPADIWDLGG